MNSERRATKIWLRNLAPVRVHNLVEAYKIPTPWKEVLLTVCVHRKSGFAGCDFLENEYNISMSYWTFVEKSKEALDMMCKSLKEE